MRFEGVASRHVVLVDDTTVGLSVTLKRNGQFPAGGVEVRPSLAAV